MCVFLSADRDRETQDERSRNHHKWCDMWYVRRRRYELIDVWISIISFVFFFICVALTLKKKKEKNHKEAAKVYKISGWVTFGRWLQLMGSHPSTSPPTAKFPSGCHGNVVILLLLQPFFFFFLILLTYFILFHHLTFDLIYPAT